MNGEKYICGFKHCGIKLTEGEGSLIWSWKEENEQLYAKQAYEAIIFGLLEPNRKWWFSSLWKWQCSIEN